MRSFPQSRSGKDGMHAYTVYRELTLILKTTLHGGFGVNKRLSGFSVL